MPWSDQVAVLYCPFQVDGRHWIDKLETLLNPIVRLMPLLIRQNGGKDLNEAAMESAMPITRLDLPFCCEPTGIIVCCNPYPTYAVEAFAAFNPEHLNDFPIA
ncbi:unnamed protein product [Brassica oleracea]